MYENHDYFRFCCTKTAEEVLILTANKLLYVWTYKSLYFDWLGQENV